MKIIHSAEDVTGEVQEGECAGQRNKSMPGLRRPYALYVDEFQNIATESFETVLAEARKFGLCLTMAHQSLKQVDDRLASLILGNAQTQVYFRVGRQDAERLAKESSHIIEQLIEQEDNPPLLQERERKFSMHELWESAFHQLSGLAPRKAYVMVKGAMEHPELIRTIDNPLVKGASFPHGEQYAPLTELESKVKSRKQEVSKAAERYVEQRQARQGKAMKAKGDGAEEVPPGLGYLE